jgi:alginate O-acetyltransferase complex protein AlgI
MLFSSQPFLLLFLPLSLLVYYQFSNSYVARIATLTTASMIFYAWWDPRFVPLLGGMILITWLVVRLDSMMRGSWLLIVGVALNLSVLGLFKYANFFAENVLNAFGVAHQSWEIILPLGISFFTFQQVSYLVDRYRGNAPAYGILEYAAFVSFFPQLIAGPIVRHNQLIAQFASSPWRDGLAEQVSRGAVLLTLGLLKKVFFADELAPIADTGFDAVAAGQSITFGGSWLASLAYSLQLYFDFSAYSDMAIGLGAMFGLRLPLNFDAPYRATDIRVFWRRWHMTLSSFLRDYVYIPLGGNRGSLAKTYWTVMATMFLCGLWHGAGWTFVAWGTLHGLAICLNRTWSRTGLQLPVPVAWLITMVFVIVGWVLVRAENFAVAQSFLVAMSGAGGLEVATLDLKDLNYVILASLFAVIGPTNVVVSERVNLCRQRFAIATACGLFLVALRVGQGRGLEFIYFQF